ncbi:MAG: POTRA domain-containing protein [Candidatus Omnitrophota bacterium]|jgi:hemolysin activation/secretion protein
MNSLRWQKEFKGFAVVFVVALAFLVNYSMAIAYDEDAGEDDPSAQQIENNIAQKREKAPGIIIKQQVAALIPKPTLPQGTTRIEEVIVTGSTLLAKEAINKLKNDYEHRDLTARQMQRCADLITRAYSREGYITSYAYIISDKLGQGILEIMTVEGKTGKILIQGNENFSTDLLMKKITLKEGQPFNFIALNLDVFRMNRHPDRKLAIQIDLDKSTGTADVTLTVKDRSPLHATLQTDNYGAQTILYNRYKTFIIHNNITGHDDSLTAKIEWAEGDAHKIFDLDYTIPLNNTWKFQFYLLPYKSEDYYYKDNEDTDFEKRARKFYFWFYQSLINKPDFELVSSYGFTYFNIWWYKPYLKYSDPTRRDEFRILKWDLALNRADNYGRWVITNDLQMAIPDFLGGADIKSDDTSVVGAKGNYVKNLLTVARRQKLGLGIDFISKARWQVSSATLTGVNAFSIGGYCGVIDNRGYPRTQLPADGGRAITLGFTFPPYFIPKDMNAPFSTKTKLKSALQLFTFWDWGQGILKSPKVAVVPGEPDDKKITTLASVGCGFTYAVPDQGISIRLDAGWPITSQKSSDGDNHHVWWSVTKSF